MEYLAARILRQDYFFTLFFSFLASWSSLYLLQKSGLVRNKLMRNGVPLTGGVSLCLGFSAACLWNYSLPNLPLAFRGLIAGSLLMFLFGFLDDNYELSIIAKFLAQIVSCSILIFFNIRTHIVNIPEPLNIIITFLWVLGITNAFNHLDVMDGLAASVALIISLTFFLVSGESYYSAIFSLALMGTLLSFLTLNFPPAKIYMGNSGSHFLGFILAAVAINISYAPLERRMALFSPVLILGFPIFDTVFLIFTRIRKKKLPFKKSNDHLVLRFLALGYSKKKALTFMSSWALFFALCGLIVSRVSNLWGIITIIFVILTSLALGRRMWRVAINE